MNNLSVSIKHPKEFKKKKKKKKKRKKQDWKN